VKALFSVNFLALCPAFNQANHSPARVAASLLDMQLELAGQLFHERTGFLDHPNGVASGLYFWASP
jgi:hypothetical protein